MSRTAWLAAAVLAAAPLLTHADPIRLLEVADAEWQTTPCVAYLYQDGAFDFVPVAR
ncbi:MAG: hypothetical protein AAFN94_02300 [Pseudomonadota bacterium]